MKKLSLIIIYFFIFNSSSIALVEVDITRGNLDPLPIAVSPLYVAPDSKDIKQEGKVIKNSLLRVLREDEIIYEGNLTSLKRFKDDVNEVKSGFECGIGVAGFYDFEENDVIEVYAKKEVKRTLK